MVSVGRPKKNSKAITVYIDLDILVKLEEFCENTVLKKSTAVEKL
jgi:hypothetical protein